MKRKMFFVLAVMAVLAFFSTKARADDKNPVWGIAFFGGTQSPYTISAINFHTTRLYDFKHFAVHPYVGWRWRDRFEIGIEGKIGIYDFKNHSTTKISGITLNLSADIIKLGQKSSIYGGAGMGLEAWDKTPSPVLVNRREYPVINHFDLGVRFPRNGNIVKIAYRLTHTSAAGCRADIGVTNHGILVGYYW